MIDRIDVIGLLAVKNNFAGSTVLTMGDKSQLLAWQEIKDDKTWTLLYKGSRDGFDAAKFHNLCDNKVLSTCASRAASTPLEDCISGCVCHVGLDDDRHSDQQQPHVWWIRFCRVELRRWQLCK